LAEVWGSVRAPDAAAFDQKLTQLAATVCPEDPRTTAQRRADALAPLAAGAETMACTCGSDTCPRSQAPTLPIVINLLAEAATVRGEGTKPGYLPGYGPIPAAMVKPRWSNSSRRGRDYGP
jgi:hypothetical protein